MEHEELLSVIEAILFAAGDPVPASRIALVTGEETQTIVSAARELAAAYEENRCGMRLVQMNDLLQLCSAPEQADCIRRTLEGRKPARLSQPALEVLAIIAYYQPVTRAYVDQVRGVDSAYTVGLLLERELIEMGALCEESIALAAKSLGDGSLAHPLPHHPEFPALLRAEQPGGASGAACRQPGGGADGVGVGGTGGPAEGGGGRTGRAGARRGA